MSSKSSVLISLVSAALIASSCTSSGVERLSETSASAMPDASITTETEAESASATVDVTPVEESVATPPTIAADLGEEVGSGAIGPSFDVAQPWPVGTIYTDIEPGAIVVDFVPPERGCIAAQVTATVGRGGAILVELFVDAEREVGEQCVGGAIGNAITVALPETDINRGFYTTTTAETGGASVEAESVADAVIGLTLDEATALIADAGLGLRDVTDAESVEENFDPDRVNIRTADGFVVFASVG